MGVYNPDMKMPKGCADCSIWKNCKIVVEKVKEWDGDDQGYWLPWNYRHEECRLIEVPVPHGDIVDGHRLTFSQPDQRTILWKGDTIIPAEFEE